LPLLPLLLLLLLGLIMQLPLAWGELAHVEHRDSMALL
jgi:hypothetical protein